MFLPWRRFSSCSFSHRVASGCRSNQGLLLLLIISHCVLHFDVPKVIVMDVFDDKTVSYSFFPEWFSGMPSVWISFFHENPTKCVEKPLNHGHENGDFRFHGVNLGHEISKKFLTGYFHEPWEVYKAMNMNFYRSWKSHILNWYISWPLKRLLEPSMADLMGHETSNRPWNSHDCTI